MPTRRYHLTPVIQQQICAFVRSGAYRRIAARAAGIPPDVLESWLRQGRGLGSRRVFRNLLDAVEQAEAQARAVAEMAAFRTNPLAWLKFGPGKERAGTPGWSGLAKALKDGDLQAEITLLELRKLIAILLDVLRPHPEIHRQVVEAMDQFWAGGTKTKRSAANRQDKGPKARRAELDGNPTGMRPELDGNTTGVRPESDRNSTGINRETRDGEQISP
jgi:hypothetical protein